MLTTTLKQLRKFKACSDRYEHLVKALGDDHGDEILITLRQVFDHNGENDANWLIFKISIQRRMDKGNMDITDLVRYSHMVYQWAGESSI